MKKISKLLIGTNNKGKYKEITDLLPKYIKTHSTSEFKLKSPREDGLTFTENSIIKSKHFSKKTKLICLADDSGLEIDILNDGKWQKKHHNTIKLAYSKAKHFKEFEWILDEIYVNHTWEKLSTFNIFFISLANQAFAAQSFF